MANYLPKVTWENDLRVSACVTTQGSRAGYSSPLLWVRTLREEEEEEGRVKKLPTCGLRAVSRLIIIISFSYNDLFD